MVDDVTKGEYETSQISRSHHLKTIEPWFTLVWSGDKKVEIRLNDRDFKIGDLLVLRRYNPESQSYPGGFIVACVTDIWRDIPGLLPDHVALCISVKYRLYDNEDFLVNQIQPEENHA